MARALDIELTNEQRLAQWERRSRPALIAAAIIPLIGVTTGAQPDGPIAIAIVVACWVVFLVDLVVHCRLHKGYLRTGMGMFDLAVVVLTSPWYLLPGVDSGQFVNILRMARLARVLMVTIKTPMIKRLVQRLGRPFLYAMIAVLVCAAIVERAEDHKHGFKTYGDSVWWAFVTLTTVGYGDLVPESRLGRITAVVLMFVGVAMLGTVAASLASLFRSEDVAQGGTAPDPDEGAVTPAVSPAGSPAAAAAPATEASVVASELRSLRAEVAALRDELRQRDTK